jgi:hypothetical protein
MKLRWAFAALAIVAAGGSARAASSWYWCEPLQAYYPWVRSCPAAWRQVDPRSSQKPQPSSTAPQTGAPQDSGAVPVQSRAQNDAPTFPSPDATPHGDGLDAWCSGEVSAINVAICGDNDLRVLAAQRLKAFNEASTRIPADQQKVLAADQNGWAMSSGPSCGVQPDIRPVLPLAPSVKDCLLRAGRSRLSYLQSYGTPAASQPQPAPNQAGTPSTAANTPTPAPTPDTTKAPAPDTSSAPQPPAANNAGASTPAASSNSAPAAPLPAPEPAAKAATPSCNSAFAPRSHNPFALSRSPSLETLEGKIMLAVLFLSAATVMLWIFALFRRARASAGWPV